MSWDVDGNGNLDALTDGILYLRYLFGFTGEALIRDSLADDATRTEAAEVLAYLESISDQLDVDGNGEIDALTDGILYLRYLFGFRGEDLTSGAVGEGATRANAEQIVAYLESITDEEEPILLPVDPETGVQYFPDELLVKLTGDVSATQAESLSESLGAISIERLGSSGLQGNSADGQWYVAKFNSGTDLQEVRNTLAENPDVSDVELDYLVSINFVPNDPDFNQLWGLNNTGQTGGNADADIDAPEAWDIQRGSRDVVVAVVDTGVDYNHPDLTGNLWTNSEEIPNNGIDDDGNGFTDDFYGYDWVNEDGDPIDDNNHGTHVAGTIGASGDNNLGVVGVSPNVSIMSLKFLAANGGGSTSDAAKAVIYATDMGADVINASFGGGGFSQVMVDALEYANDGGVLFVAAAGNDRNNNDRSPQYPASYDVPNILSVAATDHNNQIASFSNYGERTVDLGAPGVNILSSIPGNQYASFNGTSMASPHVAGAAALLLAEDPSLSPTELKNILMTTADPVSSLQGRTVTGGRLNLNEAILAVADPPRNNPPIAANDSATIDAGTTATIAVLANDSDPDGDAISLDSFATTSAAGGAVTPSGNSLVYRPASGFAGNDSFSYTISDGNGDTDSATVNVTVESVNQPPIAVNDVAITDENSSVTIAVLANDLDPDGDRISLTGVSSPGNGSVSIGNNQVIYSPDADFAGNDSFRYTISDAQDTDAATVTVTVESVVNQPPIAVGDFAIATEGIPVTIPVLDNDSDSDGDVIAITGISEANEGTVLIDGNALVYVPANNFTGIDSFTYTISDAQNTDTATVIVTVESSGGSSSNTQIIIPVPSTQLASANQAVSIDVQYLKYPLNSVGLIGEGLGLRLHWDSTKLSFDSVGNILADDFLAQGSPSEDINDLDGDPNTDRLLITSWVDFTGGSWPNDSSSLPISLYMANFTTAPDFADSTTVNFSASSTTIGFDFRSTSATIAFG